MKNVLFLLMLSCLGCSQENKSDIDIDSFVNELVKDDLFISTRLVPRENAFIRSNYLKQGMVKNEEEFLKGKLIDWNSPDEVLVFYKKVYGENFGEKMLKMSQKQFQVENLFWSSKRDILTSQNKEIFMLAVSKASKIIIKEKGHLNSNLFIKKNN
jgi:hypothetical protein